MTIANMTQEEFEDQLVSQPMATRGRKPRGVTKTRTPKAPVHKVNITHKIEAWILLANSMAAAIPQIRGDLLDQVEIHASAEALNAVAQENTMIYSALDTIVSTGAVLQLVMVVGLIGVRRAARHGLVPEQMDQVGLMLLQGDNEDLLRMMNPDVIPDNDG